MSASNKAVFISYASQDAEVARRIAEALRAAGVEVWFDQNELRGGDAWDQKIRKQIKECTLFLPINSAATQARREGYFRLEWKLAEDRTHLMAQGTPFMMPLCIDATKDSEALVPDSFCRVQWTLLRSLSFAGQAPGSSEKELAAFCARVRQLLEAPSVGPAPGGRGAPASGATRRIPTEIAVLAVVLVIAGLGFWYVQRTAKTGVQETANSAPKTEAQRLIDQMRVIYDKQEDATRRDWSTGEALGRKATELEPGNAEAWAAYAQMALGMFDNYLDRERDPLADGLKRAQQAIGFAPDSIEARFALASAFRRRAATVAEAEEELTKLVERMPNDARVLRTLSSIKAEAARTATQAGDPAKAASLNEAALALLNRAPNDVAALRKKALLLETLARFPEATATLAQSMKLPNGSGPGATVQKIASLLLLHDDLKGAREIVEKLPGSYYLHEELSDWAAMLWLWDREPTRLLAVANGWTDEFLSDTPTRFFAAQSHRMAGRTAAAPSEIRSALGTVNRQLASPAGMALNTEMNYLAWKARLQAALGETAAGETTLREFDERSGSTVMAKGFVMGIILVELGHHEAALTSLEGAVRSLRNRPAPTPLSPRRLGLLWVAALRHDPTFDPLREMPRFKALLEDVKTLRTLNPDMR